MKIFHLGRFQIERNLGVVCEQRRMVYVYMLYT